MRKYFLTAIITLAALAFAFAQVPQTVTLRERASASPDGRYVTYAPSNTAPTLPDIETITRLSPAIITGTPVSNRTRLTPDGSFVNTVYEVTVSTVLKGNGALLGNTVRVGVPGGVYKFDAPDGRPLYAEVRTPWFRKMQHGRTYLLFLTNPVRDGDIEDPTSFPLPSVTFGTTGGPQGVFEVVGGAVESCSGRLRDPVWQYHGMAFGTLLGRMDAADPACCQ